MREFRFRLERRLESEVVLAAVARWLEGAIEAELKRAWRTDSRSDRSIVVSQEVDVVAPVRALEAAENVFRRLFRGGLREFEAPRSVRVQFLSAQAYPTARGATSTCEARAGTPNALAASCGAT